jgi:hypothetical protein
MYIRKFSATDKSVELEADHLLVFTAELWEELYLSSIVYFRVVHWDKLAFGREDGDSYECATWYRHRVL